MANLREAGVFLAAVAVLACGAAADEPSDAAAAPSRDRALVAKLATLYEAGLTHRCGCLVDQDLLYDSVEACQAKLGWDATGEQCIADAFDEHGTDTLRSAMRCHVRHLETATACAQAVSCEELLIDGACDATSADNPCGQGAIDLYAFIFEHCPQLDLHARQ